MQQIIGGKRYDTETAALVASNYYWDGSNWQRRGRNMYLYKTPNNRFFLHHTTLWQGERDYLEAVGPNTAKTYYEELPEHVLDYETAFGEAPEEA
jgi:hypothetical protein